ncbi:hypothetical protein [Hymenobacter sp. DG01]|uniref:hypothetical protein n=1 Tax=Hymenobacter sp. DG01 TaxID=2584940 RepID=UPI00111EFAA4|nr:hypothetical protein [Hymenobacter sp. DG01]
MTSRTPNQADELYEKLKAIKASMLDGTRRLREQHGQAESDADSEIVESISLLVSRFFETQLELEIFRETFAGDYLTSVKERVAQLRSDYNARQSSCILPDRFFTKPIQDALFLGYTRLYHILEDTVGFLDEYNNSGVNQIYRAYNIQELEVFKILKQDFNIHQDHLYKGANVLNHHVNKFRMLANAFKHGSCKFSKQNISLKRYEDIIEDEHNTIVLTEDAFLLDTVYVLVYVAAFLMLYLSILANADTMNEISRLHEIIVDENGVFAAEADDAEDTEEVEDILRRKNDFERYSASLHQATLKLISALQSGTYQDILDSFKIQLDFPI